MLIKRTSLVRCDGSGHCAAEVELEHDLEFVADAGYPFNKALSEAGWGDVWLSKEEGYGHLCPPCLEKYNKYRKKKYKKYKKQI